MITQPNKKKPGVLRRSNLVFFLESWQRRRRTRVQLQHRSLAECGSGHHCESVGCPMTPRPARPAHILAACWMNFAAVVFQTSDVVHAFVDLEWLLRRRDCDRSDIFSRDRMRKNQIRRDIGINVSLIEVVILNYNFVKLKKNLIFFQQKHYNSIMMYIKTVTSSAKTTSVLKLIKISKCVWYANAVSS